MTLEVIQEICRKLDNVTEDIKWGHDLCFNIGGKMFLVTAPDSLPVSASFKTSDELFNGLTEKKGFKPAPYLAKHNWVYVDDINRLSNKEWKELIELSYNIIKSKLPKKKK
jgi:predicted DNA-binding protein (MmcQ/YjbR family)